MWPKMSLIIGTFGGISAAVGMYNMNWLMGDYNYLEKLIAAVLSLVCGILTLVAVDMIYLQPAESHTLYTIVQQYIYLRRRHIFGKIRMHRFLRDIKNCRKIQSDVLRNILSHNQDTEYGRKFRFNKTKSFQEFAKLHPLTTYENYKNYMVRVVNGEQNILTKEPAVFVGLTSGTTGKNKEYPLTQQLKMHWNKAFDIIYHQFPPCNSLKRYFQMRLFPPKRKSDSGLEKAPATVFLFTPHPWNIVPNEINRIFKEVSSFYIQALYLLHEPDICYVEGFSSNLTYSFFKLIEEKWKQLCDDISDGTIWSELDLDEDVRKSLTCYLKPNVSRANQLREEFGKGMIGLVQRIWPDLDAILMASTGSFSHCAELLESSFLKGIEFKFLGHGSTEALMGISQLTGGRQSEIYTLYIRDTFFEFIPIDQVQHDQPRTLFPEQLEAGHCYEIVVTTFGGLYRYRVGDIIEVVDPGNGAEAPTYIFKYRLGQILNVAFERTPESLFYKALKTARKDWPGISIEDYTTTESFILEKISGKRKQNKNYLVFVEVTGDKRLEAKHTKTLDDKLCQEHERYKQHRMKESVAQLEIIQVTKGTFQGLKERLMGGRPNTAFKMPRVLRNESCIKYLLEQSFMRYNFDN